MATRRAVASWNWSSSATRDTDTGWVPWAWDDVYTDWYIVTLDVSSITCDMITNTARTGWTAWWYFLMTSNKTINANIVAWNDICLRSWSTNYNLIATVNWNVTWWDAVWAYWIYLVTSNGWTCKFNITWNVMSWNAASAIYWHTNGSTRYMSFNIVWNITSQPWVVAITCHSSWYINQWTVTWNCTSVWGYCITNINSFTLIGNGYADSWNAIAVANSASSTASVSWTLENSWSTLALADFRYIIFNPSSSTCWRFYDTDWNYKRLYTADAFGDPSESDVRDWVDYWIYTWTLKVPDPSNVASGVPTDDTVWTADFALTDVMTALGVVNEWVKKASILVPHTTDLS